MDAISKKLGRGGVGLRLLRAVGPRQSCSVAEATRTHASGSLNTPCQTLSAAARVLDRRAIELRDRIHGGSRMKFTITFAVAPSKASSSWSTGTSVTPEAFRASLRSMRAGSSAVNAMLYHTAAKSRYLIAIQDRG